MQMPDVNVLVDAWHVDSAFHGRASDWLHNAVTSPTPLGLSDQVLSGAIRILTNRRIPGMAWPIEDVLDVVGALISSPGTRIVRPGRRHWTSFTELCRHLGASGNLIPDCYLAALAMENKATFVSRDRFFASVPGLTWNDLPEN